MVFSSLIFIYVFLPINFILYYMIKNQIYRNWVLILASLFFYAWGEPVWITILLFSTFFDYMNGIIVQKYRGKWQSKGALIASVSVNLILLGFFKYAGFIVNNVNEILGYHIPFSGFALPIGISFYTFQTISYVVDVYRGEVAAQRSPFKLLLFVSLFHQLVAGPIVRYKDIADEIEHRKETLQGFSDGINRFVVGLGKKVILANTAGEISELFLRGDLAQLSVMGAWFGIMLFALQIYYDFSGYSDMAIGLGKMFGFTYLENFNYPYISRSATEFWRRWHISLGSFFRDYVYIPLGGNRKHPYLNLLIVWFLTGLWHGSSWNFIIWGIYYGILIMMEKVFLLEIFKKWPSWLSHVYLVTAVLIGWVFFYFTSLSKALAFIGIMFGNASKGWIDPNFVIQLENNLLFVIMSIVFCTPVVSRIKGYTARFMYNEKISDLYDAGLKPVLNLLIMVVSAILLVGQTYNPFLYFRF